VEELRAQGWDQEAIDIEYAEAKRLAEPSLIWPENWTTALVFLACKWSRRDGLEKVHFDGIPAQEIMAVMFAHRVPRKDWPEVFNGVRLMELAALPVLNSEVG
jgi:hypothetical protein